MAAAGSRSCPCPFDFARLGVPTSNLSINARLARAREKVLEEKVAEWRRAVERVEAGETVSKEDMQVREAKLVERVVDGIFASER